ncbi:HPF/RaiA family ribosome-associated protein [Shimia sp. R11_0]|uniref:HPF/RaiA family ribosome-associated protein n=1 Tax=Shimia sp. R11_0 TaxID=2821096 RepID=UPI001AD9656A|nr:HPF/RaiA family ribosome-associated protein [Shimia sp. R11_0]MBO9477415.1 HPF/RaiA family ribosome-associated protein [Shimia sp. R11_0]
MQIQVNTDNFIHGDARVVEVAELAVNADLDHLRDRLTRVEVHLKDQNADKHGPDHIRCTMEARPRGMDPLSAHHDGADISAALKGAAKKLRNRLSSEFGKADKHH